MKAKNIKNISRIVIFNNAACQRPAYLLKNNFPPHVFVRYFATLDQ